jgi:aspartate/methionine/tyrosine aminotransferase
VGWLIADNKTLNKIRDYKDYTTHCVPLISETITRLAVENIYRITKDFIKRIKNNWFLLKNNNLVKKREILLINYDLEGGCVCFLKINGFNSFKLAKILVKKYNISVMPGEVFNKGGYTRINLAQKTKDFKYLLKSINLVLKNE